MPERVALRRSGVALAMVVLVGSGAAACDAGGSGSDQSPAAGPVPATASASASAEPTGRPTTTSPSASPGGSSSAAPTPRAAPETYASDFSLTGDQLSFQPLRSYWGAKAQRRCREKQVKASFEWCNDYYYEKSGATTSATLPADVTVALVGDGATPEPSTRAALLSALEADSLTYARLGLEGDTVTEVEQVFVP